MGADSLLTNNQKIVIFDTSCLLCSRFVRILLSNDHGRLNYAGFESKFAQKNLPNNLLKQPETVVYFSNGNLLFRSTAVFAILAELNGPIRFLRIFKFLPLKWRDALYNYIAKNRYLWFGKSETCFLPKPEQQLQFLD